MSGTGAAGLAGLTTWGGGLGCAAVRPIPTSDPRAAFFAAVQRGDLGALSAQLSRQPSLLDARDDDGRSGFTVALLADQAAAADLLRRRGYRPDLIESSWVGDWERFEALAGELGPDAVNAAHALGGSAMYAAARGGHGAELWRVFAACAVPNPPTRPPSAPSPLRAALDFADLGAAEMTAATLLANGADPNAPEPDGSTALHAAASRGSVDIVEMLIRKGARVDARDRHGRDPLALAEHAGHRAVSALLRDPGAIARDHVALRRAFDVDGRRYRPVALGDVSIVDQRSFVGLGHFRFDDLRRRLEADPRLVHAIATTTEMAVEAAGHTGRVDIVDYLLARGAPYSMPAAVLRGDLQQVAALLQAAPERVHERGPHDFPLTWYPVLSGGSIAMAELLLARGADIESQHFMGTTALHMAARAGQLELVAFLIERGAVVDRVGRKFDARGQTPHQLAVARGHDDVARLLEERGARPA
ncbi:MAG: hypothetical protein Tsb0020_25740 [Haliangiales bacterium]